LAKGKLLVVIRGILMSGYANYPNKCMYCSEVNDVPTQQTVPDATDSNLYCGTCISMTSLCTMELIVQVEAIVGYLRSCLQGTWRT
jgi:hypothetical protein